LIDPERKVLESLKKNKNKNPENFFWGIFVEFLATVIGATSFRQLIKLSNTILSTLMICNFVPFLPVPTEAPAMQHCYNKGYTLQL